MRHLLNLAAICVVASFGVAAPVQGQDPAECPQSRDVNGVEVYTFADGSIGMRTPLAVNPDGGRLSYTAGDHGFTYVANGVDLRDKGQNLSCKNPVNGCRDKFLEAERLDFAAGTAEFCAFALEVERKDNKALEVCKPGAHVIGNGKGRPRTGPQVPSVTGAPVVPYLSKTSLRHTIDGQARYLDSMTVPTVVVDRDVPELVGRVVWLRWPATGRRVLAVAGDLGPRFGEASISVHQLLRYGALQEQSPGPIPVDHRCKGFETGLKPPFESRPDLPGDACGPGQVARSGSDIRAYAAIDGAVEILVLGKAGLEMATPSRVAGAVSDATLRDALARGGYDDASIDAFARCLR